MLVTACAHCAQINRCKKKKKTPVRQDFHSSHIYTAPSLQRPACTTLSIMSPHHSGPAGYWLALCTTTVKSEMVLKSWKVLNTIAGRLAELQQGTYLPHKASLSNVIVMHTQRWRTTLKWEHNECDLTFLRRRLLWWEPQRKFALFLFVFLFIWVYMFPGYKQNKLRSRDVNSHDTAEGNEALINSISSAYWWNNEAEQPLD